MSCKCGKQDVCATFGQGQFCDCEYTKCVVCTEPFDDDDLRVCDECGEFACDTHFDKEQGLCHDCMPQPTSNVCLQKTLQEINVRDLENLLYNAIVLLEDPSTAPPYEVDELLDELGMSQAEYDYIMNGIGGKK